MPLGDEQAIGLGHREAAQHDRVEQREHGRRAADPERERRDRDRREHRTSAQEPETEPDILKNVREHGKHRGQQAVQPVCLDVSSRIGRKSRWSATKWSISNTGLSARDRALAGDLNGDSHR